VLRLQSDRGEGYRIRGRDGFTHISATTPFSLLGRLAELRRMGCRSLCLICLRHPLNGGLRYWRRFAPTALLQVLPSLTMSGG
jgi:hypothetical protein